MNPSLAHLQTLASSVLDAPVDEGERLPGGGSERLFYRFRTQGGESPKSVVGVIGRDLDEVAAFLAYTQHFTAQGIPVAHVHAADPERGLYLMEDLGEYTLSDRLRVWRDDPAGRSLALNALHAVVRWLAFIQVRGGVGLEARLEARGIPTRGALDGAAFQADIQLFQNHYVPRFILTTLPLDVAVQHDLDTLAERLDALPRAYFSYRDFQARNVMWGERNGTEGPVFLDYQGGRPGPLAYDLASLLYSPDTTIGDDERLLLIDAYLAALEELGVSEDRDAFLSGFYPIVLVRRLQALGAYTRLAVDAGKPAYLYKIPPALATLRTLLAQGRLTFGLPALERWLGHLLAEESVGGK